MKVKIISAKKTDWYHAQIGSIVNVDECTGDYKLSGTNGAPWISMRDCEVIDEPTPQPKPFDLERALKGEPIFADGYTGEYIFTNKHTDDIKHVFQLAVNGGEDQAVIYYSERTKNWYGGFTSCKLFYTVTMAPKEPEFHEAWVNSSPWGYSAAIFSSEEEATKRLGLNEITTKIRFQKP